MSDFTKNVIAQNVGPQEVSFLFIQDLIEFLVK